MEWTPLAADVATEFIVPCPAAIAAGPVSDFVGREAERTELEGIWSAVAAGARRTVLIEGEAGAGKTRLAFEFARQCCNEGAAVLLGACDTELALPYQPWVQALEHLVTAMPPAIAATLGDHLADVCQIAPQIERMVPGLVRPAPTDPETERYRLFKAVDALVREVTQRWPLVIVIDDLHWAGAQTLALLRHLAGSTDPARLLVVGTFRDTATRSRMLWSAV